MAHFNTKDQQMLEEAYQNIQEGMWDRFKTKGAEALGSAKGMGQQFKGGLQQAAGAGLRKAGDAIESSKFKNAGDAYQAKGNQNVRSGQASGHNSKIEYLQKNLDQRIQKFVADIKNDIQKLGLDVGNIEMISGINDALNQLKMSVDAPISPPLPQQVTPPPLPKQEAPQVDDEDEPENPVEYSFKNRLNRKKKVKPTANPRKGKVNPNRLRDNASRPEEEELYN